MTGRTRTTGRFTGRHIAAILVAFFAVVIAVNLTMASLASSTFGGTVVENSYVASQHFNRWLDEAAQEKSLALEATMSRSAEGRVLVVLSGDRARGVSTVEALARRPFGRMADRDLTFVPAGENRFLSTTTLPAGRWTLRLQARTHGEIWRTEEEVY